ncbi:MAG: ABC transporter ATP-binding protein [bacterium]
MPQPLKVEKLSKSFYGEPAVRDLSFSVKAGEMLGIVGPNGAGKTTTIKMILGLLRPDSGRVSLFGKEISDPEVRRRIGYMPESPSFYAYLTGRELLQLAADLFDIPKKQSRPRIQELLDRVGLKDAADRGLGGYSKGMLQRICLAQALVNKPELLFLDEPLDGLDPLGRVRMKEVLLEIRSEGTAIVLNSHILSDVEVMSDRIAIVDRGQLLRLGSVSELIPMGKTLEQVFIETIEQADASRS